mmetsp:Transcript_6639/g.15952  ORF Transcript_6639/g.15952 Transcript_6639/m.15952 type:complete len:292 (-) Transcript_6639:1288-2163(-)
MCVSYARKHRTNTLPTAVVRKRPTLLSNIAGSSDVSTNLQSTRPTPEHADSSPSGNLVKENAWRMTSLSGLCVSFPSAVLGSAPADVTTKSRAYIWIAHSSQKLHRYTVCTSVSSESKADTKRGGWFAVPALHPNIENTFCVMAAPLLKEGLLTMCVPCVSAVLSTSSKGKSTVLITCCVNIIGRFPRLLAPTSAENAKSARRRFPLALVALRSKSKSSRQPVGVGARGQRPAGSAWLRMQSTRSERRVVTPAAVESPIPHLPPYGPTRAAFDNCISYLRSGELCVILWPS